MKEKLIELLTEYFGVDPAYYGIETAHFADHLIANGVTITVRCEDCKCLHIKTFVTSQFCSLSGISVKDDDFCSYGERKDNENK